MSIGKSIRIYLADSTAAGIRYAELVNWTGHAVACPRNRLGELTDWPETSRPGVYFLFEARLGDAKPQAYIGESENVAKRLLTHDRLKEFWNEVVIFTSKDENLTKAHVKHLESTLAEIATQADRYALQNGNTPTASSLPRADRDAMTEFVQNIRMVLGTLGYPILEPLLRRATPAPELPPLTPVAVAEKEEEIELVFRVNNLVAHGVPTDEGFVLKKDSQVSPTNTDSAAPRMVKLKEQLLADGRLRTEGDHLVLVEDILISSSTYAAVLVAGTARSGPQSWVAPDGRTLKSIEDAVLKEP